MAKDKSPTDHQNDLETLELNNPSRRSFFKRALTLGVACIKVVTNPLVAFARPIYNFTFFRAVQTDLRVTQSFAVAATQTPNTDVRVTQSFAVAATQTPNTDVRVTQSFVQVLVS